MAELKTAAALKSLANASRLPKRFQAQTLEQSCCSFQNSFLESPSDNFTILFNSLAARRRPYQPAPEIFCRSLRIWHPMKYVMLWMRYGSTLAAILQSDNHCQSIIHYLKQQHRSPVKYIMIRGFISPLSRCTQRQLWFYLPGINGPLWLFIPDFGQNLWIPIGNSSLGSRWHQILQQIKG